MTHTPDLALYAFRARPAQLLHRPLGAATEPRAADARAAANMSATSSCRAWRMSRSCARLTRMPASCMIDDDGREAGGRRDRDRHRRGACQSDHARGSVCSPISRASNPRRNIAIAVERACWQGEAVCAVVARTRAQAEDACELVHVKYEELTAGHRCRDRARSGDACDPRRARRQSHFERKHQAGDPDQGFALADAIVETTFSFGRHTGVTNEPRAIVADWNPGEAAPYRLPGHAGAAHDAEPVRQAPRSSKSIRCVS